MKSCSVKLFFKKRSGVSFLSARRGDLRHRPIAPGWRIARRALPAPCADLGWDWLAGGASICADYREFRAATPHLLA